MGMYNGGVIAFDIDDVLVEFSRYFFPWWNENYLKEGQKPFRYGNLRTTVLHEELDMPESFLKGTVFPKFIEECHFENFELSEGAEQVISYLSKKYDVHAVTSRTSDTIPQTKRFMDLNFPSLSGLHFATKYFQGTGQTKTEICRRLGAQIIVEDQPRYAEECLENGMHVVLIDRPTNRFYKKGIDDGLHRVYSLEQACEEIESLLYLRSATADLDFLTDRALISKLEETFSREQILTCTQMYQRYNNL